MGRFCPIVGAGNLRFGICGDCGAGLGTAAGLITSGAIDRAIKTQKAKKELKEECDKEFGVIKDGKCVSIPGKLEEAKSKAITKLNKNIDDFTALATKLAKSTDGVLEEVQPIIDKAHNTVGGTLDDINKATEALQGASEALKNATSAGQDAMGIAGALAPFLMML